MSQAYTNDHSASVVKTHGWRNVANSAAYLLPHLRPDMRILDIGCGPGSITIDLARSVPHGSVVGVEYVPDPLDQARLLAQSEGISNVSFQVGDVNDLAFEDNTFDVVHAHQVLQHLDDPIRALKEMRRVVKPGGIVAARDSTSMTWYPDSEGIEAWRELGGRMRRAKGNHPDSGKMLHVWAKEAGFPLGKIKRSTGSWCFSTPDERKYWGGSMADRSRSSGFATMAIKEGFASQEDLEKIARGWHAFVEDEDAWMALLHGEILCWK